jgi:hypothetical protein
VPGTGDGAGGIRYEDVTVAAAARGHDRRVAMTKEQVVELATAQVGRGEDRIERVYRWHFKRVLAATRAAFVAAGSILVATVTAIIHGAVADPSWRNLAVAAALASSVAIAGCQYARLGRLYGKYLESLRVFAVVQRTPEHEPWIRSRSS